MSAVRFRLWPPAPLVIRPTLNIGTSYAVIIAGGSGTRFWPLSTPDCPKPFCKLIERGSCLLAATWERLDLPNNQRFVVVEAKQVQHVQQACPGIVPENILAEPQGRDTAAAIALASAVIHRRDPAALVAILPADHAIAPLAAFQQDLQKAFALAGRTQKMVLIGVRPTRPETGYGYIEPVEPSPTRGSQGSQAPLLVKQFLEKPSKTLAEHYFQREHFFWNCGMLIAPVEVLIRAIGRHLPLHGALIQAIKDHTGRLDSLLEAHYPKLPKISIDHGVLEKVQGLRMLPGSFQWSDLGDWSAVAQNYPSDPSGNTLLGQGNLQASNNTFVYNTQSGHTIAVLGLSDVVVIHTPEATLICPKEHTQAIRGLKNLFSK